MLRLDWLEIIGFKSFAEKTRVDMQDGINCVLGPNGCGKSNLADAIAWILGAGSAHSMRGENMEDIIFGGTRKRNPSGVVKGTLSFSRSDRGEIELSDSAFSGPTLEVSRKLYRSGESIYSINQRRCRLKDVRAVLDEAGLGFASYAMIAQGKIGWFLRAKPTERRSLLEEAAGITGYKSRRRSAELKLELAQQNLLRINDIVLEIERRLRSLKRQAAKARRYQRTKERFQQVHRRKLSLEAEDLGSRLQELVGQLDQHTAGEAALERELAEQEKLHLQSQQQREELQAGIAQLKQEVSENRLQIDRTENSLRYQLKQIETFEKSIESNSAELAMIERSLDKVEQEGGHLRSEYSALDQGEKDIEARIQEHTQVVGRYENEVSSQEETIESIQRRLVELNSSMVSLNNLKVQLEEGLRLSGVTRQRLEAEQAESQKKLEESGVALESARRQGTSKRAEIEALDQSLREQEETREQLAAQLKETRLEMEGFQKQLIAVQERLHSLAELEVNHAHYSEGVQQLLRHLDVSRNVKIGGTLADRIETLPEYERLVEEFLDEELEYVLVDSLEEAFLGASELRGLESGRCTFLTLSSNNGFGRRPDGDSDEVPSLPGIHGTVGGLIQTSPDVSSAFHRALPQRADAIVVSDLDRALQLVHDFPERTFVTLEGESLTPRGLLSASSLKGKKLGLLSIKRQKRELEVKLGKVQQSLTQLEAQEAVQNQQLELASESLATQQQTRLQLERELIGLSHEQEDWQREGERRRQTIAVIQQELERVDDEQAAQSARVGELDEKLAIEKVAQLEAEGLIKHTHKSLQQLRSELGRSHEQLHMASSDQKVFAERRAALEQTLNRIREQQESLETRQSSIAGVRQENERRLEETRKQLQTLEAELRQHDSQRVGLTSQLGTQEEAFQRWKEESPRIEEAFKKLRERQRHSQQSRSQYEVEQARVETQLQSLRQQSLEHLQMSLEEAAEGPVFEEKPEQSVIDEYQELKHRLETFGPINLTALEEYQEAEERYNFLSTQQQDIQNSITDTSRAIQEINRRSRHQFRETFDAINQHFKEVFQTLFGGGECGIRLLDEEDLLESGIDVYAQPPGKKLQNVRLLSGGEEALTVFALLMGIFIHRPSRFCILDEVDAPLDDTNVDRFNRLVKQMSDQTQFIIITHNKRTMENANGLYGVTMEEPGVSNIVSVLLDNAIRSATTESQLAASN